MAITDPSGNIEAYLTDTFRQNTARAINGELVFRVKGFTVGRGGYVPTEPLQVVPVDPLATTLIDQIYPTSGYLDFEIFETPTLTSVVYNCRLPATLIPTEADCGLGELGIWAEIIYSTNPVEIGQIFLMAITHMPIRAKTNRDVMLFRVVVNY